MERAAETLAAIAIGLAAIVSTAIPVSAQTWQGSGGFRAGGGAGKIQAGGGGFRHGEAFHSGAIVGKPVAGMIGGSTWRAGGMQPAHKTADASDSHREMDHHNWQGNDRRRGHWNEHWHYGGWGAGALLIAPYSYSGDAGNNDDCVNYQPVYDQWGNYLGQQAVNACADTQTDQPPNVDAAPSPSP